MKGAILIFASSLLLTLGTGGYIIHELKETLTYVMAQRDLALDQRDQWHARVDQWQTRFNEYAEGKEKEYAPCR